MYAENFKWLTRSSGIYLQLKFSFVKTDDEDGQVLERRDIKIPIVLGTMPLSSVSETWCRQEVVYSVDLWTLESLRNPLRVTK